MQGRLNTFQKTILLWNEIHAYNAVHVVRIPGRLDVTRLTAVINGHLEHQGLINLSIDRAGKRFHYQGGTSTIGVKILANGDDVLSSLHREIQDQLNLPFPTEGRINPFRFFAAGEEESFYLGLVYFHLIASADSIIRLLKNIVLCYMEGKRPEDYPRLTPYTGGCFRLIPLSFRCLPRWLFTFPGNLTGLRQSYRPRYRDTRDGAIGFSFFSISPARFRSLLEVCRQWDVTVNDLFLALLLKALSPLAHNRFSARRRKKISVASIVNIRKDLSVDDPACFGAFLSSFRVTHAAPDNLSLEGLARDIRDQTRRIKNNRLYLRTILEMELALFLTSTFFRRRKTVFYSKYYPLWGGITNIHVNTIWSPSGDSVPVDYFRAVSTGHATPLVFSFTTVNDTMNIGVSFRETVFFRSDVETLISAFSRHISQLTGGNL